MKTTGIIAALVASNAFPLMAVEAPTPQKNNVLFIVADDLGWRDTAVYGSTFYKTPNIDALAASGVRFTNAYSANPLCSPTRASIMTGQYPVRHGLTTASGHVEGKQEHKDGVSYVPALHGKAFDRGPTICDMPHPVWATYNIPNTFVQMGDWKMYRFWYDDPKDQSHRYELYNLKDDIGETKNLAEAKPEQLKPMIEALDKYYKETGVLTYHPNSKYNKRTVGTWFASSDDGTISAKDGALLIKSNKPGYSVKNHFFPPSAKDGFLIFEARSPDKTALKLAGPDNGKTITPTENWKEYEVSGSEVFIAGNNFSATLEQAGQVELRNVRATSPDKTEMMRYVFY